MLHICLSCGLSCLKKWVYLHCRVALSWVYGLRARNSLVASLAVAVIIVPVQFTNGDPVTVTGALINKTARDWVCFRPPIE